MQIKFDTNKLNRQIVSNIKKTNAYSYQGVSISAGSSMSSISPVGDGFSKEKVDKQTVGIIRKF